MFAFKGRPARGLEWVFNGSAELLRLPVQVAVIALVVAFPAIACAAEEPGGLGYWTDAGAVTADALPEAPVPMADSDSGLRSDSDSTVVSELSFEGSSAIETAAPAYVPLEECPYDQTKARECRMHWRPLLASASTFLALQNTANLYTSYWYRYETMHGEWWDRYVDSVARWRWDHWSDDNPFLDDYIGHPMMGAITNSQWIGNDPKGMTLEQSNTWPYWRSRLRALEWSTLYSFEWKLGPVGEAGIGHNGDHFFTDHGVRTNETGWVELVTTPVGGLGWTLAEDALDRHVVRGLEGRSRNPVLLSLYQFLTPARAFANLMGFRPPWYRESRVVKATNFFSDERDGYSASTAEAMKEASWSAGAAAYLHRTRDGDAELKAEVRAQPEGRAWEGPGGKHELGAAWGLSLMSGHVFGYAGGVKYMPIVVRYSYEFARHKELWRLRYSPEVTAVAMMDWPTPKGKTVFTKRQRVYGSGVSPVSLQMDFRPLSRVQPFVAMNGGFVYFADRVLNAHGSQWMYTIGPSVGVNFFRLKRQAITIGYRYDHLSNANISLHNPGTDANVFYLGVSRFRTRGE